ncbi:MAG: S41 family peptidase [Dysgonamonadaceae bacterium]|nr:S41 family peptidase [Dysgonamonadaceae bacterium]
MRNILFSLFIFLNIAFLAAQQQDNHRSELAKNLDIYNSLMKELDLFYVDSIQPNKLIPDGINLMLSKLDPYTNFISEEDLNDFKFMVTGEYGGIGSIITQRKGRTYISEPYEGMPAALAGLKAGDEILAIDDVKIEQIKEPAEKLKGIPNTKVKIKYLQAGSQQPLTTEILRKRIQLNPVSYHGVVGNNTGYIYLSGFTEQCAQQVKLALEDLKKNRKVSSLILDLRNNPGGSMEEAIQIVNLFVPKGKIILSTKGKVKQWDRIYRTTLDATDEEIPLVVLINENSASASEIVSGAIQDLDRGVLIGRRTFGKGLVQTTRELPFNTSLKVTTSKYYIPSGRCIQAVDYTHRSPDGKVGTIPDSLTSVFYTEKGRPVRDGGGITPDIKLEEKRNPNIVYYLLMEYIIFDYATQWVRSHPTIAPVEAFDFPEKDYDSFKAFVKDKNFTYDRQSEKALSTLKEIMQFEGYTETASEELKALESKLYPDLDRDLELNRASIVQCIAQEIVKRYYYQKGEIIQALKLDDDLKKALEIVDDINIYHQLLSVAESSTE